MEYKVQIKWLAHDQGQDCYSIWINGDERRFWFPQTSIDQALIDMGLKPVSELVGFVSGLATATFSTKRIVCDKIELWPEVEAVDPLDDEEGYLIDKDLI